MRSALFAVVACTGLTAAMYAAAPQKIVFTRVFPNDGQIGLFVAARDGSDEHPLLATRGMDYDPVWSPDGQSIVFTSDREGSADLFRVKPDGSGLERLTDSPAYDDQGGLLTRRQTARAGHDSRGWKPELVDNGHRDPSDEGVDVRGRRGLPSILVS